ncbi:hypothetical protein [Mesorhizobium sangaii]|uniref:Spermidine/putrescine-binding protein n=1 Tax=Mesorhizobium sangaii TaxID=505389 RepID=A0A841PVS6_9HYPH|nr:hypothetical protein [Mesorhizobium sangaii]MBB6414349.1 spermidine/putrescine-binding protein [Mesorhizobium sangaii]
MTAGTGVYFDTLKELFFDPFTKETGIETVLVNNGSYSEVLTKVHAMSEADAMEWDVFATTYDTVRSPASQTMSRTWVIARS